MAILTDEDPSKSNQDASAETSAAAETAASIAEDASRDLERVEKLMGRQHIALYAFIGVFLAVLVSAMAYLAGRQGPNPVTSIPAKPVTVISSAVPATVPAPDPVRAPVVAKATATVAEAPVSAPAPVAAPAPKPVLPPAAAALAAAPLTPAAGPAVFADVLANRMYLQVGSLDKKVAGLITQGLRIRGVSATLAPGVSETLARIIVGPFDTTAEMGVVQKQLTELGFQPFPRQFQRSELIPAAQNASAMTPAVPLKR